MEERKIQGIRRRERKKERYDSLYLCLIIWFLLGAIVTLASGYIISQWYQEARAHKLHSHLLDLRRISAV